MDLDSYAVGMHNCALGNSWIKINNNGKIKTIRIEDFAKEIGIQNNQLADLSNSNYEILSRNGWTKLYNLSCRNTKENEKLYTFKTRTGLPFTVTGEHRLPVLNENNNEIVKEAKNIKVGETLLSLENVQLSSEELSYNFLNLMDLDDENLDLRIINLEPLRHFMRYRYGIIYAQYFNKKGFDLKPNAESIKVKDFKKLMKDYPLPFDLLSVLRIKSNGSTKDYPLFIPYSRELAKVYAYIYADGGVYEDYSKGLHQLTFANKVEAIMDDFLKCYESVFGYRPNKCYPKKEDKNNVCITMTDRSKVLVKLFKNFAGARKNGADDISIPDFVMNGNNDIKYAYISACIDTDGCISERITYSSCCKQYCEQLQLLLQSLNVKSIITECSKKNTVYHIKGHTGIRNFNNYSLITTRKDEAAMLLGHLSTYKFSDAYSYKGLDKKYNESKIVSIETNVKKGTKVYDVETGDHWFILNNYVSHNCLTYPLDESLSQGVKTRQTSLRPAKSVNTAFQLVAVLFQLQSLQQFGR